MTLSLPASQFSRWSYTTQKLHLKVRMLKVQNDLKHFAFLPSDAVYEDGATETEMLLPCFPPPDITSVEAIRDHDGRMKRQSGMKFSTVAWPATALLLH